MEKCGIPDDTSFPVAGTDKKKLQWEWKRYRIKGPIVAEFAFRRVVAVRDGLPDHEVWLIWIDSENLIL
ncbi:MAG: hypothetical protein U9Q78_03910 [Chloroflexota bacterium]|nr:hypothetical protein [Chloroflexota bacterium]